MPTADEIASAAARSLRDAQFAFIGRVRGPGTNVDELASVDGLVVVHVDEAILAPLSVGDLEGRDVTVRVSGPSPRRGQRALFLATSWVYGTEIAVIEVARISGRLDVASLRTILLDESLRLLEEALMRRLAGADLVVAGTVAAVEVRARRTDADDEDAPMWRVALIDVMTVVKGRPPDDLRVPVLFPYERTRRYSEAPLFHEGQEGIWLLRGIERDAKKRRKPDADMPQIDDAFTALDPLDYQAPSVLPRVHVLELLSRTRSGG